MVHNKSYPIHFKSAFMKLIQHNSQLVYIHKVMVHNKNYPYAVLIALHIYKEIILHTRAVVT